MSDSSEDRLTKIKRRWTDNGILVREGFPVGVLAYEHVMWLIQEVEKWRSAAIFAHDDNGALQSVTAERNELRSAVSDMRSIALDANDGAVGRYRALQEILAVIERTEKP